MKMIITVSLVNILSFIYIQNKVEKNFYDDDNALDLPSEQLSYVTYSSVHYIYQVVHYIPTPYLSYNWEFVPSNCLYPILPVTETRIKIRAASFKKKKFRVILDIISQPIHCIILVIYKDSSHKPRFLDASSYSLPVDCFYWADQKAHLGFLYHLTKKMKQLFG